MRALPHLAALVAVTTFLGLATVVVSSGVPAQGKIKRSTQDPKPTP